MSAIETGSRNHWFDSDLADSWALNALKGLCTTCQPEDEEDLEECGTPAQLPVRWSREYKTKKQFLKTLQKHFGSGQVQNAANNEIGTIKRPQRDTSATSDDQASTICRLTIEEQIRRNDALSNGIY